MGIAFGKITMGTVKEFKNKLIACGFNKVKSPVRFIKRYGRHELEFYFYPGTIDYMQGNHVWDDKNYSDEDLKKECVTGRVTLNEREQTEFDNDADIIFSGNNGKP